MDVYQIEATHGEAAQRYYHLSHVGTLPPADINRRSNWTPGHRPGGVSKAYQAHDDILIPDEDTEGGADFARAIANLRPPDMFSTHSLGGGGTSGNQTRDQREYGGNYDRNERETGKQGIRKKSKRRRGVDNEEERGVDRGEERRVVWRSPERGVFNFGEIVQEAVGRSREEEEDGDGDLIWTKDPFWSPEELAIRRNTKRNSTQEVRQSTSGEARRRRKEREDGRGGGIRRVGFENERNSQEGREGGTGERERTGRENFRGREPEAEEKGREKEQEKRTPMKRTKVMEVSVCDQSVRTPCKQVNK
jgi:hypothetical protein